MHHRSLAMRYSLFSMLPRWFSMHHILFSMHDRIPTNVVAKLQLNSDIPTNSDKIFIVFPVFYSYPSLHAVLTSTRIMTISAKIMMTFVRIMMTSTKIMMTSTEIMMAFVKIMTTSSNNITASASLLSLSATPQALFAPKEHLPTPVLVKGVTAEVLIFSAETLVI